MSKRKLTIGALVVVLSAAFLSYFSKYTPDLTPTVDPAYELNAPELQTTVNPQFAEKLVASNIAMVLIHSDFSDENAVALDSLRSWAKDKFSQDKHYLHPVSVQVGERQNTVFSAFFANLFGPERGLLERGIKQFLGWRIDEFHNSDQYSSFRLDYYGLFGVDPEAATLLARYQEERAKLATETITGFLFVLLATVSCFAYYIRSRQWISRARLTLSYGWFASSLLYLGCGWYSNEVSYVVSAMISAVLAVYLRYPLRISFDEAGYLEIRNVEMSTKMVTGLCWVSLTLAGIQILTWIKTGSLISPDPVTLLISSLTGNFLHDPTAIKRHLIHAIGAIWLISTISTMYVLKRGVAATPELEAQLANLDQVNANR
jgi:hypothetical protein